MNPSRDRSPHARQMGVGVWLDRGLTRFPLPVRMALASLVGNLAVIGFLSVFAHLNETTIVCGCFASLAAAAAVGLASWHWCNRPARDMLSTVSSRQKGDGQALARIHDSDTLGQLAEALNVSFVSFEKNQRALAESESLFRCLAENIGQVFWVANRDRSKLFYVSPAFAHLWGRSTDSLYRRPNIWLESIHPDDRERVTLACSEAMAAAFNLEYRVVRPDGSTRWIHDRMFPVRDPAFADRRVGISEDITERRNAEEKFRLMFEQSSDAHLLIADEHIVDCNPAAIELLRAETREQILGLALADLLPSNTGKDASFVRMSLRLQLTAASQGKHRFEWTLRTLEGNLMPVEATLTRVSLSGKNHLLLVWHDVTERLRAEETLREEKAAAETALWTLREETRGLSLRAAKAERATEAKSEFLASMSLDLRAPLNDIVGLTDQLVRTQPSPEQEALLKPLKASAEGLVTIIDDLLDFTRIDAGQLKLEMLSFNLKDCLSDVMRLLQPRADAKGLAFQVATAEEVPIVVLGDPLRVRQVLLNLAGNAIKFTRAGHVRITARLARTDALNRSLETQTGSPFCEFITFSVSDSGIGISRERQARLFSHQLGTDTETEAKQGGAGLGLTISKRLVEMMGGAIGVQSDEGIGSTFWFTLPILACSLPTRHPLPVQTTGSQP